MISQLAKDYRAALKAGKRIDKELYRNYFDASFIVFFAVFFIMAIFFFCIIAKSPIG